MFIFQDTGLSDDDGLDETQVQLVEQNSELTRASDREPVKNVQQNNRVMEIKSDCIAQESSNTSNTLLQTEITLDIETQVQVANKQEQNGSILLETDTSDNMTVNRSKVELKMAAHLDAAKTEVANEHVDEREESVENMRPVNDILPGSDDANTVSQEKYCTDNIVKSQASVTSLHNVESSTSTQLKDISEAL